DGAGGGDAGGLLRPGGDALSGGGARRLRARGDAFGHFVRTVLAARAVVVVAGGGLSSGRSASVGPASASGGGELAGGGASRVGDCLVASGAGVASPGHSA